MRRRLVLLAGIALLGATQGCSVSCTLIGCVNGLHVGFSKPPTEPFRVEVRGGGIGETVHVYECTQVSQCIGNVGVVFEDYYPTSATITVIAASGTTTTSVTPEYRESQPNGARCGPTCRQATVTVPAP